MLKDATGNEIVIGNKYGYYRNTNGFTYVTIGEAKSVTEGKVNLINRNVKRYIYNDGIKEPISIKFEIKGTAVFANILFSVN